jgi:hypothetical protein
VGVVKQIIPLITSGAVVAREPNVADARGVEIITLKELQGTMDAEHAEKKLRSKDSTLREYRARKRRGWTGFARSGWRG